MNKSELVNAIACRTGKSKKDIKRILDVFMDITGDTLADGEIVRLIGFGTFSVVKLPARIGRNPRTGEKINIKARRKVKFKAGADLATKVN